MKLKDLVELQTAQIIFKAANNSLPGNIQKLFIEREGGYNLRGKFKFKIQSTRTTRRSFCVPICGIKLWNSLNVGLKECPNIIQFKKMYKEMTFHMYRNEGLQ